MTRPSKREVHNKLAGIKSGLSKIQTTISAQLAVLVCIAAHITYETFVKISILLGHKYPDRKKFTKKMRASGE